MQLGRWGTDHVDTLPTRGDRMSPSAGPAGWEWKIPITFQRERCCSFQQRIEGGIEYASLRGWQPEHRTTTSAPDHPKRQKAFIRPRKRFPDTRIIVHKLAQSAQRTQTYTRHCEQDENSTTRQRRGPTSTKAAISVDIDQID